MATTVSAATFQSDIQGTIANSTGARHSLAERFSHTLKDGNGDYLFDRVLAITDYSLTTAAGNLDIDLYDLGTLDIGAGAGQDNLGLSHANARIIAFAVQNQDDTGGTLRIDNNGATNPWVGIFGETRVFDMAEGAFFMAHLGVSGKTVTDASDHIMRVSAQTADCTIDIVAYTAQS